MSIKAILCVLVLPCAAIVQSGNQSLYAQSATDPKGDVPKNAPAWTDLTKISIAQEVKSLSFTLETADSIPKHITDSCQFQMLLQTEPRREFLAGTDQTAPTNMIAFDLSQWDGSPWFATNIYSRFGRNGIPADTSRLFDWKLSGNTFKVRFSLESLGWTSVKAKARVFYGKGVTDVAPDSGWVSLTIDRTGLENMKTRSSSRTVFTYPQSFDSLLSRYDVLQVVDAAYVYESNLTGVTPIGGDTVRFIFNPFYGGAAIEGDPIYLGPGMWGKNPLWFVYFHEMGHNFVNASARFRQLYPLETKLIPGPLPTNILFYEAWASLPAMYAYDALDKNGHETGLRDSALSHVLTEWKVTRSRFQSAWVKYKGNPIFTSLNPDIVDGMFLELQERFGWSIFKKWFAIMRPAAKALDLFNEHLSNDTHDLRATRCTLTAAALSAAAGSDLQEQFKKWGFPIDEILFAKSFAELSLLTH